MDMGLEVPYENPCLIFVTVHFSFREGTGIFCFARLWELVPSASYIAANLCILLVTLGMVPEIPVDLLQKEVFRKPVSRNLRRAWHL
jgi:hypothetical protein